MSVKNHCIRSVRKRVLPNLNQPILESEFRELSQVGFILFGTKTNNVELFLLLFIDLCLIHRSISKQIRSIVSHFRLGDYITIIIPFPLYRLPFEPYLQVAMFPNSTTFLLLSSVETDRFLSRCLLTFEANFVVKMICYKSKDCGGSPQVFLLEHLQLRTCSHRNAMTGLIMKLIQCGIRQSRLSVVEMIRSWIHLIYVLS